MQNMNRNQFLVGAGLSSLLTACGGGSSSGSGGSSIVPGTNPTPSTSIKTQIQSITNSSSMGSIRFYLNAVLTGVPFAAFIKEMSSNATVKASPDQVAMYQVLQFVTAQNMIVGDIFSKNALTVSQKATLASFQKGLASNSFAQKMTAQSNVTSSTVSALVASGTQVQSLHLGPIPTPSPDKALDALVEYFNTLIMSPAFKEVNSSLISTMQANGFAAWLQSRSPIARGTIMQSLSSVRGISTMGFRSLEYDYGALGADFALPTRTNASIAIFAFGVATVGLAILAAPEVTAGLSLYYGAVAAARLSVAIVGGGYLLYNQIQRWNNGLDFNPPVPLNQSPPDTSDYGGDPRPPSFLPDPGTSEPYSDPGSEDTSDPNTEYGEE